MNKRIISKEALIEGILKGDIVSLSKSITLVESLNTHYRKIGQEIVSHLYEQECKSIRIGITGVPGAGKSTFINELGMYLCKMGYKVAVLAIDPSSQLTGGSVLGDKLRMQRLSQEVNSFIRPSPTGKTLGGVAKSTRDSIFLCEAAGYEVILVETVGVGQVETVVRGMVDFFLLLTLSGAGDEVQGVKRGILELVDGIVVNKADGENLHLANETVQLYSQMIHYFQPYHAAWMPFVLPCSSIERIGIDKIWNRIKLFRQDKKNLSSIRMKQQKDWLYERMTSLVLDKVFQDKGIKEQIQFYVGQLENSEKNAYEIIQTCESFLQDMLVIKNK